MDPHMDALSDGVLRPESEFAVDAWATYRLVSKHLESTGIILNLTLK